MMSNDCKVIEIENSFVIEVWLEEYVWYLDDLVLVVLFVVIFVVISD